MVAKAPSKRLVKISSSFSAPSSANKSLSYSKRFYAGHGHHEEAPKPYKRTALSARPTDSTPSPAEREREVQGIEGWIFGRKVSYIDPLKPIANTEAQSTANGWLWNTRVRLLAPSHHYAFHTHCQPLMMVHMAVFTPLRPLIEPTDLEIVEF